MMEREGGSGHSHPFLKKLALFILDMFVEKDYIPSYSSLLISQG
jgi:hypothetical protein